MIVIDLILTSVLMLYMENKILREKYIIFSPYTFAQFSLLYIYILPFVFYNSDTIYNYISRIDNDTVTQFLLIFRIFYYLFCILSIFSFIKISNRIRTKNKLSTRLSTQFILISSVLLIVVILFSELRITGFNISIFIDKMINPRKYTFFTEGLGPLNHLLGFAKAMLLFISFVYRKQIKNALSNLLMIVAILINVLGGSKSSLLFAFSFAVIIFQKMTETSKYIKFRNLLYLALAFFIVAVISFMLMSLSDEGKTISGALESIIGYSQEAYYSSRVIRDFSWSVEYINEVLRGLVYTPIPRAIFSSKGFYGLYNSYWRPFYQQNTVQYHTSTYGFLAEAHMLFGVIGPFLYAILFNSLFERMYIAFFKIRRLYSMFFLTYVSTWIYLLMRSGLFMPTNFWIFIIVFFAGWLFFLVGNSFNPSSKKMVR